MSAKPHYIDLTQKFFELRGKVNLNAVQDDVQLLAVQNESDPAWVVKYQSVITNIDQIHNQMLMIASKQEQKKMAHYQEALNEEILLMRGNLVKKLQDTNKLIKKYEATTIEQQDAEGKILHKYVTKNIKSQMNTCLFEFKLLQSKFLDSCTNKPKEMQLDHLDDQSKNYYLQTQQQLDQDNKEVITIAKDINEIVDMVAQLTVQIYECGTILDRIDQNLTQAEDYIEEGNEHLKDALQTQEKVNYMRMITYFLILVNFILSIVMITLKVMLRPHPSPNPNPNPDQQ